MGKAVRWALLFEFALELWGIVAHPSFLPLGGNHAVQIAVCLGCMCISVEVYDLVLGKIASTMRKVLHLLLKVLAARHLERDDKSVDAPYRGPERRQLVDRRNPPRGGRRISDRAPGIGVA